MTERRKSLIVYCLVLAVAILWNLSILAAPWSWVHGHPAVASAFYFLFSPLCHQRADRSFYLWGHHFAVCNRCTGIYEGALIGLLLFPLLSWIRQPQNHFLSRRAPHRSFLFVALLLVAADVGAELLGWRPTTPLSRFLTGAFCGIVAPFYLLPSIFEIFAKACKDSKPTALINASEIGS